MAELGCARHTTFNNIVLQMNFLPPISNNTFCISNNFGRLFISNLIHCSISETTVAYLPSR